MSLPILYAKGTTSFGGMGLGVLRDCLKCNITREINGEYEMTLEYPSNGIHFEDIELESLITAKVPDKENYQIFKVYSMSEPIDMTVTIDCEHISYITGDIPLKNFTNQVAGVDHILEAMNSIAIPEGITSPFIFDDTLPQDATVFTLKEPCSMREVMGNGEGMLLSKDYYKDCEWDFDNYNITLTPGLGEDKSNSIHYVYGKNVSDISQDQSLTNMVTGIMPYVHAETDDEKPINVIGGICYGTGHLNFARERILATNVESYFTNEEKEEWHKYGDTDIKMPTAEEVTAKGEEALQDLDFVCVPEVTIKVNPVDLTGISGYEQVAENLKRVRLGDTIKVIFNEYSIEKEARIISVTYDVLNDTNESVEIGDPSPNLAATLASIGDKVEVNRAGIIVGKDSILAYVDKANGQMGSQIRMTEDEIKSTVAMYTSSWNMVPLTGSRGIGGEGWTIQLYNYGEPGDIYKNPDEYAGYNYFDEETGFVWECVSSGGAYRWQRKKFNYPHTFRWYDENGDHTVTAPAGVYAYTIKIDGYCTSNITQLGNQITQEISNRATGDQSIINQTPSSISMRVTSPDDVGGERNAGIYITTRYGDGSERTAQGVIEFDGVCVFKSNLEDNDGTTVINGGNIRTGLISAQRIDVNNLTVKRLETNADSNGYTMAIRNGDIKVYAPGGVTQISNTGVYYLPFTISENGSISAGWKYYYGIDIYDPTTGGYTWFLFGPNSTIIRLCRPDGNLIPPASVILHGIAGIADWLNLRVYLGLSYDDTNGSDAGSEQRTVYKSTQIKAKYWNSNNRRIMFKNCRSGMGTEGTDYDKDDMGATTRYVKWYHGGGDDSDRRWKNSVEPIDDVSDKYMKLNPVSYRFNEGIDDQGTGNEIHFGLIAQEVDELYPNGIYHIVNHAASINNEDLSKEALMYTPDEYYKLRYEELHALHISMIQKHEKEIQELKEQIKLLQNKED